MHVYSGKHTFFLLAVLVAYSSNSPPLGPLSIGGFFVFHTQMFDLQKVMEKNQKEQTKAKTVGVRLAWALQWIVA